MYAQITGENPYETPMRIYPAVHYTMGGLWVDYDLQSSIPGLYVTGEANFSDHGANRLGASALMQGLADGYFVLPNTINDYLAAGPFDKVDDSHPAAVEAVALGQEPDREVPVHQRTRTVDSFHKELGHIMWDYCGMERTEEGLRKAITRIRELKQEFWSDVRVLGTNEELNQALERAGRVADFIELGELMCIDALVRTRIMWWALPSGVADRGRRGVAARRRVRVRVGVGVRRRGRQADPAQGALGVRVRRDEAAELQVSSVSWGAASD